MAVLEHVSLKGYNTFGIGVSARYFTEVCDTEALRSFFPWNGQWGPSHLVLGGGSNILFTSDFPGLVLRMGNKGIEVTERSGDHVLLNVQAGEDWDALVSHCVEHDWGGMENLSLIPGQAGTSPMQNIGAYGTELKDIFHSLKAFDKETGKTVEFGPADCQFGYRDSYFKNAGKDRYVITSVCFRLTVRNHRINTAYGAIAGELEKLGVKKPGIREVREAVIRIRESKLPDPEKLGNAGSFFKNPVVSLEMFRRIREKYPEIVAYPDGQGMKLAAGWMIEKAGWKGYRMGDAGVHDRQALVLVNHGSASGAEIVALGEAVRASVAEQFGVDLDPEVNITGT
jgi:UDP-N-acetylmuramate dehydrogenase